MVRKNKIIISALIVCLFLVIGIAKFSSSSGYKISITNNTNKTVKNLKLKYKVGNTIKTISQIKSKESWKGKIDTNSIQGENSIILTYEDNKGDCYEEYIVGYLEKGYSGVSYVIISKINENGKLKIKLRK